MGASVSTARVAVALTAYSGILGRTVAKKSQQGGAGATEPSPQADEDLAKAQRQLKVVPWAIPVVTGSLVVLAAQPGEQQRPQSLLRHQLGRVTG